MRSMLITAKHHDGFDMFQSHASPWNIHDATPFKRKVLAELAAACREQGMRLGFSSSPAQHWNHPGGTAADYPGRDWETCMTMNGTWGYKVDDDRWKGVDVLIRDPVDIAGKGDNYLLNAVPAGGGVRFESGGWRPKTLRSLELEPVTP